MENMGREEELAPNPYSEKKTRNAKKMTEKFVHVAVKVRFNGDGSP